MARNVDAKGGNCDVIFDKENGIAKKYLCNTLLLNALIDLYGN